MNNSVMVELSEYEAKMFMDFRQHQDEWGKLLKYKEVIHRLMSGGVFDIKNGSSTIHFDSSGVPTTITVTITKRLP